EALRRIAELYRIEDDIRGQTAEARRAVRQERSRPILAELEPWLREKLGLISQKTKLAEAIRYTLSRWEGLTRFIDDGRIEIDSNTVERSIRPITLNRKNALFAGSDGGAEHWGGGRFADRDLQAEQRRAARLSRRRAHWDRQRPPKQPDRRSPAVGLHPGSRAQGRGLKTPLTVSSCLPSHRRCGNGFDLP